MVYHSKPSEEIFQAFVTDHTKEEDVVDAPLKANILVAGAHGVDGFPAPWRLRKGLGGRTSSIAVP
jgi:hypothetical protein